jgi:hypothetical protein
VALLHGRGRFEEFFGFTLFVGGKSFVGSRRLAQYRDEAGAGCP